MPRDGQPLRYNVHQELRLPRRSAAPHDSGGAGGAGAGGTVRKLLRSNMPKRRAKLHATGSLSNATTLRRQKQSVRDLSVSDAEAAASGALEYMNLDSYMKGEVGRAVAARHRNRVVVPLFANLVVLPFLKNMLCSMARLSVENWAVVALDMETCGALKARGFATAPDSCVEPYRFRPLSDEAHKNESSKYGSPHFWRLVIQRPLWVQWLMQEGYSVLQCDVDIVWLHNPLPFFEQPAMQRYSALYQSEQVYGMNCGFYFMRPDQAALGCVPRHASGSFPLRHLSCCLPISCVVACSRLMQNWLDDMYGPTAHHVRHPSRKCALRSPELEGVHACVQARADGSVFWQDARATQLRAGHKVVPLAQRCERPGAGPIQVPER